MLDALFVLISIVFFAVAAAYVRGCERLRPRSTRSTRIGEEPAS